MEQQRNQTLKKSTVVPASSKDQKFSVWFGPCSHELRVGKKIKRERSQYNASQRIVVERGDSLVLLGSKVFLLLQVVLYRYSFLLYHLLCFAGLFGSQASRRWKVHAPILCHLWIILVRLTITILVFLSALLTCLVNLFTHLAWLGALSNFFFFFILRVVRNFNVWFVSIIRFCFMHDLVFVIVTALQS